MGPKQQYGEKLKDPRWQKKRLEVLERAQWRCSACGAEDRTLHVHHLRYVGEPWEAPDDALECLCEICHTSREEHNTMLSQMLREAGTAEIFRFGKNVAGASRLFDTAPSDVQAMGPATFVIRTFNIGIEKIGKSSDEPPENV